MTFSILYNMRFPYNADIVSYHCTIIYSINVIFLCGIMKQMSGKSLSLLCIEKKQKETFEYDTILQ